MQEYTDAMDYVMEQLEISKQRCKGSMILIEQESRFSSMFQMVLEPELYIVSDETLHIVILNTDWSVLVDAYENPQIVLCPWSIGNI